MNIKTAREAAGLTREELAYRLGTTDETLQAWESGYPFPLRRTLMRIELILQKAGQTNERVLCLVVADEPERKNT